MNEMYIMEEFLIANGMSQLPNSSMTNDLSPYDYFDGGLDVDIDNDFSDARGSRRARRRVKSRNSRNGKTERRARRDKRRDTRQFSKSEARSTQRNALANISNSAEADAQLLAQLTQTPATFQQPTTTGMNRTTKNILIVGGVSVALVVGFMLYKKFKK